MWLYSYKKKPVKATATYDSSLEDETHNCNLEHINIERDSKVEWAWVREEQKKSPKLHMKITLLGKALNTISYKMNPTFKNICSHNTPILYEKLNSTLGKAELNSLQILLDSGSISSIALGKHT